MLDLILNEKQVLAQSFNHFGSMINFLRINRIEMKIKLILLTIVFIVSGCNPTSKILPSITPDPSSTITATLDHVSTVTVTPSLEITNTIAPTISPPAQPRIILFIGDGMGANHRIAAQYYSVGEIRQLAMDAMPSFGWLHTDSLGDQLTESASAATALATGQKTYTGMIAMDIHGNRLKTILEYAQDLDMSTGLISTKHITDSTSAAFAAHVESSAMGPEIASQFIEHRIDVIFGGGENDFLPRDQDGCHPEKGKRTDGRNLIQEAIEAGYTFICDQDGFRNLDSQTDTLVLGLFADDNMVRPFSPSLAELTQTAIEILSLNPNGYFLVVEGATIDTASHYHQTLTVFEDVVGLDQAVQVAMEYAEQDENMLVIVTADHETGGLHVNFYPSGVSGEQGPFRMPNGIEFYINWSTGGHTAVDVPVTSVGPGSEKLVGIQDNTIVFNVMLQVLGIYANK